MDLYTVLLIFSIINGDGQTVTADWEINSVETQIECDNLVSESMNKLSPPDVKTFLENEGIITKDWKMTSYEFYCQYNGKQYKL